MKLHNWQHVPEFDFNFENLNKYMNNSEITHSYAFICSGCGIRMHTTDGKEPTPEPGMIQSFWDCDLSLIERIHEM